MSIDNLIAMGIVYLPKFALAVTTFFLGLWLIGTVVNLSQRIVHLYSETAEHTGN